MIGVPMYSGALYLQNTVVEFIGKIQQYCCSGVESLVKSHIIGKARLVVVLDERGRYLCLKLQGMETSVSSIVDSAAACSR